MGAPPFLALAGTLATTPVAAQSGGTVELGAFGKTVQAALRRFGIGDDRITLVEAFGEAYPIPDDQVPQEWKDINTRTRDKGKWWDRRVDITSGEKPARMTACSEPPTGR